MINADMRNYDYFIYGEADAYGQQQLSETAAGTIKMAINIASQSVRDSVAYSGTEYTGLTHAAIDDSYVIQYGEERLKVLYVNPRGRFKQVYLTRV